MQKIALLLLVVSVLAQGAQPVRARHGMVVSRETHATQVGVAVLQSGGNAVDAAVAVGFALAVTHPFAGNLGGGGFMLVRMADGRSSFIDFRERAPAASSHDMYLDAAGKPTEDSVVGYRASGIPGTVRGFEYASKKYGKKPWAQLIDPAVALATKGFPLSYGQALSIKSTAPGLSQYPESNRIFLRNGKYYEAGEVFVQPELARTLERIARFGAADFYEGEIAHRLVQDIQQHGGLITLADLKDYKAIDRPPLTGKYRGFDIITSPPPSSGGVGILQMLGMLEGTGYEKGGAGSAQVVHYLAEVMRRYFADRSQYLGDPDFFKNPLAFLLDPNYIRKRRESIDPEKATPSSEVAPAVIPRTEANETTHYTIADSEGNLALVTFTLNGGYGNKVTVPGLGFLLNNEMDDFASKPGAPNMFGLVQGESNAIQPGKTPLSSMVPTIVLRGGKPYLALGSPGGPTIITTVLETMVNVMDFGMNVQDAVNWPRFHHQWLPDLLNVEPGYSPDTIALLTKRGYIVHPIPTQADCAAILFEDGWLAGAPDPRTEATAQGY